MILCSLDFNGAFQFSKLGDKGIILQIQQILWTIFRNSPEKIKYVSFLIEGKRKIKSRRAWVTIKSILF